MPHIPLSGLRILRATWFAACLAVLAPATATPLTNLAHLDFLGDRVTPPAQAGHSTYRIREAPDLEVLWTYAEATEGGAYRRVGGGEYDAETDTWGQGAYNTDDLTRAAVVYLRHWQATGKDSSRTSAYELLRTVAYMQTLTPGPSYGNVVLWMQPDGLLNPSAEPVELPDPSDSGASYWLARTLWALGEGYEAFAESDPEFAAFLERRFLLALTALERQVLVNYPTTTLLHGFDTPTWLINGGADASSEAVYGLSAYVRASDNPRARRALKQLAEGIMLMRSPNLTSWPFGATLPWTGSRSLWHGWGAQMAGALAVAGEVLDEPRWVNAAVTEASTFVPHLLTQGGADQGWLPAPADQVQIAYGADAVLQNLLQVARVTQRPAFEQLASVAGAWYFGNNRANVAMYDPTTGRTFDGLEADGSVNQNSGAESTIHGLLSVLALDQHPEVKNRARTAKRIRQQTWQLVEAEAGELVGEAQGVTPESAWTGEAGWSGGAYVVLNAGGQVMLDVKLPTRGRYLALPVFLKQPVETQAVGTRVKVGPHAQGTVWHGGAGKPGTSPNRGFLTIERAPNVTTSAAGPVQVTLAQAGKLPAYLDAILIRPEVAELYLRGEEGTIGLLHSWAKKRRTVKPAVPVTRAVAYIYDAEGRLLETVTGLENASIPVAPGGFSYITGK